LDTLILNLAVLEEFPEEELDIENDKESYIIRKQMKEAPGITGDDPKISKLC
jgi:hypothetical protein